MKDRPSYFSIQPYGENQNCNKGFMLYFHDFGYCQHNIPTFKEAYKLAQRHIRTRYKDAKVKPKWVGLALRAGTVTQFVGLSPVCK
jgi:hypothetical protein